MWDVPGESKTRLQPRQELDLTIQRPACTYPLCVVLLESIALHPILSPLLLQTWLPAFQTDLLPYYGRRAIGTRLLS